MNGCWAANLALHAGRFRPAVFAGLVLLWHPATGGRAAIAGQADGESPAALVRRANEHVAAGAIPEALAEYAAAEKLRPGSPVIAYNRGVAQYRAGDYAKAAESFLNALVTREPALEARARFNLGNTAYATALQQQGNPQAAVEKLKEAIGNYRSVLDLHPGDHDARGNIERAQTLIRQLLEPAPQQPHQQQSSSDPNQPTDSQPQEQPPSSSQPSPQQQRADPNGQQSRPQDANADEEPSQTKPQRQEDPNQGSSRENDAHAPAAPRGGANDANQPAGEMGVDNEDPNQGRDPNRPGAAATPRAMLREEAERLLQLIRDRERQRREELARRQRAQPVPVERDW